jgi:hypothetical protein
LIDKKTVFVLGAGASCPYGYQSGAGLRAWICLNQGFRDIYLEYKHISNSMPTNEFISKFSKSSRQSIDLFMAANPKLAPTGKYIIAFAIFEAEKRSQFREEARINHEWYSRSSSEHPAKVLLRKGYFQGEDWYSYLFNRLTAGLTKPDVLPDFSDDKISFITFNYDRSLEQFLYESLSNTFTEVPEPEIVKCLKKLKILHVYGQIAPLRWQNSEQGVDYRPRIDGPLLEKSASNIKTIYEQKESSDLNEARGILAQAEQIFFLGFGYAEENLEILKLPDRTKKTIQIYGTAFGLEIREKLDIRSRITAWLPAAYPDYVEIGYLKSPDNMDCLKLLRNYL